MAAVSKNILGASEASIGKAKCHFHIKPGVYEETEVEIHAHSMCEKR